MSETTNEPESGLLGLLGPDKSLRSFASTLVQAMPLERQAVFALVAAQRLSYPEIAHRLGIAEDSVKFHIRDGLRSMRREAIGQLAVLGGPCNADPNDSRDDQRHSVDATP